MSSIIDWLSDIGSKIASLPSLIYDKFTTVLSNIKDAVLGVASAVYGFFKPFIDFVKTAFGFVTDALGKIGETIFNVFHDTLIKIIDGITSIPKKIFKFIKRLFIPQESDIHGALEKLKSSFDKLLFSYELTALASGGMEFGDVTCTLYGKEVTILDASLVLKGIGFFRSIIRGFIALLLVLFNVNQFLGFIGQPAISIVGGIRALQQSDSKSKGE